MLDWAELGLGPACPTAGAVVCDGLGPAVPTSGALDCGNGWVWAYAPGHGVGMAFPSGPREKGFPDKVLTIQLSRASDLSVVVTLPDGKPAVGAKVVPWIYGLEQGVARVPTSVAERLWACNEC